MKESIQSIQFIQGLPSISIFDENYINLLITDDWMSDAAKNEEIKEIFTVDSRHMNINVFFLVQNLFHNEKNQRTISININYSFLIDKPLDRFQIFSLARQLYSEKPKFIMECFRVAVMEKRPWHHALRACFFLTFKMVIHNFAQ